jgi:hypothetical protein
MLQLGEKGGENRLFDGMSGIWMPPNGASSRVIKCVLTCSGFKLVGKILAR